jgi:hypothetical protein
VLNRKENKRREIKRGRREICKLNELKSEFESKLTKKKQTALVGGAV